MKMSKCPECGNEEIFLFTNNTENGPKERCYKCTIKWLEEPGFDYEEWHRS